VIVGEFGGAEVIHHLSNESAMPWQEPKSGWILGIFSAQGW
jgi:hypothetical protein